MEEILRSRPDTRELRIPSWIRWADVDGNVALLDLSLGRYLMLDEEASRHWSLIAKLGHVPPGTTESFARFIDLCERRGILTRRPEAAERPPRSPSARVPTTWRALATLRSYASRLRGRGFADGYREAQSIPVRADPACPHARLQNALRRFRWAENLHPGRWRQEIV